MICLGCDAGGLHETHTATAASMERTAHLSKHLKWNDNHEDALLLFSQQRLHVRPARANKHDHREEQDAAHEGEDIVRNIPSIRVPCATPVTWPQPLDMPLKKESSG